VNYYLCKDKEFILKRQTFRPKIYHSIIKSRGTIHLSFFDYENRPSGTLSQHQTASISHFDDYGRYAVSEAGADH
jgi:hypothetical protein